MIATPQHEMWAEALRVAGMGCFEFDPGPARIRFDESFVENVLETTVEALGGLEMDMEQFKSRHFLPNSGERSKQAISELLRSERGPGSVRYEGRLVRTDGTVLDVRVNLSLKRREGLDPLIWGTIQDISLSKQAERSMEEAGRTLESKVQERTVEIERMFKVRDELIQQMGHDLKTPLTPLMALLPLLKSKETDPGKLRMLTMIEQSVYSIQRVVVNTLDLARVSSPNVAIETERLDLHDAVEKALKLMVDEERVNVQWVNQVPLGFAVAGDRRLVHKLLCQLLANASQYSRHGGTVTVTAMQRLGRAVVRVADQGQGLAPQLLERVFDAFAKADPARHELGSTGLGLAIARRVVERHGGTIWAESYGPEKGSTFSFTLPLG